jgi:nucleoside-diphosphate-sugar epimerase
MHHLITGGSGFLGNLIARHFYELGDIVSVLDTWRDETQPSGIKFIGGSVLNKDLIRTSLEGVDIVHHTAALVPLTKSGEKFHEVNVTGSKIVVEEAANAGIKNFIHLSSSAIFGCPSSPVNNNSPLEPLEIYGKSKLEGELVVREVATQKGMNLISVRPRTILGHGRLGIFQILFDWIKDNSNIYVIGSGENKIQFLHAEDLINAYMLVYSVGKPGLYNVGTDRFGSIRSALENLCTYADSKSKVLSLPSALTIGTLTCLDKLKLSPLAPWHYLTYGKPFYFDIDPLLSLGWKPHYSNDQMLQEAYDNFVADYAEWQKIQQASPHRRQVKEVSLKLLKMLSHNR